MKQPDQAKNPKPTEKNAKEQSRENLEKAKKQDKAVPLHGEYIGGA